MIAEFSSIALRDSEIQTQSQNEILFFSPLFQPDLPSIISNCWRPSAQRNRYLVTGSLRGAFRADACFESLPPQRRI